VQQIRNIKEQLKDKADKHFEIASQGGLDSFVVNHLEAIISGEKTSNKDKIWAIAELTKIAWYKDNPKITIIQSWFKQLDNREVLTY